MATLTFIRLWTGRQLRLDSSRDLASEQGERVKVMATVL